MVRTRKVVPLAIAMLALGAPALATQPQTPPDRATLTERLESNLERIDAMRARILEIQAKIEAGENPENLIDPETDRWLIGRGPRFDRPAFRPEGGPDGRPEAGPGRPDAFDPNSAVDLDAVRALINEHIPRMAERLREAEATDPEAAERFLVRIAPRFRDILELSREAPELVEVRLEELRTGMEIVAAAREMRRLREQGSENDQGAETDSDSITVKRDEIRALLARQFDLRQTLERHRLTKMVKDINAATKKLDAQRADKESIIDGHLERVLNREFEPGPGDHRQRDGFGRSGPDGPRGDRRDRSKPKD